MKLISAFIAAALAENNYWPGQVGGPACGSQLIYEDASVAVNSTCTVSFNGFTPQHVSIPNCYNPGQGSFDNIECDIIVGGDVLDILVFWEQPGNDTWIDTTTCGNYTDISVSCSDNGAPPTGNRMGNMANNYHSDDQVVKYNVDFYNPGNDGTFVVTLADQDGIAADIINASCISCESVLVTDGSSLSITVGDFESLLNQVEIYTSSQISNIKSTI